MQTVARCRRGAQNHPSAIIPPPKQIGPCFVDTPPPAKLLFFRIAVRYARPSVRASRSGDGLKTVAGTLL